MNNNINIIQKILENEIAGENLIYPFISGLNQREKAILELRGQGLPLSFIGKKLRVTRERVRQIEEKAKDKLEFQKKIILQLSEKLGEYLFEEKEIEKAFENWYIENKKGDFLTSKIEWQDFCKNLWQFKQNKEDKSDNKV